MKHLHIILLFGLPLIGFGQGWEQTFGGTDSESGESVQQTIDGGYIIVGTWLIKTYSNGDEEWINENISGESVQQTTDGGYIITGDTGGDVYLIKTDGNGEEQWLQTFGGEESDGGNSVQQTSDGGYVITGMTESFGNGDRDVYLIKTDDNGNLDWEKIFGGTCYDSGSSVQQTSDGGYIITGYTCSYGGEELYLIKTNENGDEQWSQTFGGIGNFTGNSIQQTTNGGYIICGTKFLGNFSDVYLIKIDDSGSEEWSQTFGGENIDQGYSVQQTSDGGYIITGVTGSFGNELGDVYLIKTDSQGNITSTIELPTPTSKRELIKTTNILGQENTTIKNQPLIEIYDDGSTEKKIVIE